MIPAIAYRETIRPTVVAERRYIRFSQGRGHFAHLQLQVTPTPAHPCSVTRGSELIIPYACYTAAVDAMWNRLKRGPLKQLPMDGFEVRFTRGTYLERHSYPEAFAVVASMALDEALQLARPAVIEPWIGLRLRVEQGSVHVVLDALTQLIGEVPMAVSFGPYFVLKAEVPQRILPRLCKVLGASDLETFQLPKEKIYRVLCGQLPRRVRQLKN